MKRPVAFVVISTLLVWIGTVCAQIITGSISFSQIAGTLNLATQVTGILVPANGGVGAMTGAPAWARYFGTGDEGGGPASGALALGEHDYTSWTCTGAITIAGNGAVLVRSQGAVNLNTNCTITTKGSNGNSLGDYGGAGASGGSGAANSVATKTVTFYNVTNGAAIAAYGLSALAAASSSSAGSDGGAITAPLALWASNIGPPFHSLGGSAGSAGGSSGGAAGAGAGPLIIIAPSITIASGVIFNSSGAQGGAVTANSTGGGGGGGAGPIQFYSETFTDNGAIYKYGGGPGGHCEQPSIVVTGGGCDTTGCGTDALITVTGVTTGGLDATKMTLTNAGTGYKTAPDCTIVPGGSGLIGSPACHFAAPVAGAIALPIVDTAGSGATFTAFTTCFVGGYGANGWYRQALIQ